MTQAFQWWKQNPAMRAMKTTPLIFVEAWNELGEGSYIVPTKGDKFDYTKALKTGIEAGKKLIGK